MLRDFTPNEPDLLALTAEMRERLVAIVHGQDGYVCVPVQGVGNTANEAVLGTLVPRERKVLIVDNGYYGARLREIAAAIGVPYAALELPWTEPVTGAQLDAALAADAAISHVIVCHVDTGTGLLNPIEPLAEVAKTARRCPDRGRDRVVRRSADRCRSVGSRGDRSIAEQMAGGTARHRPRGREAHGARGRGRPGAFVLPGSASAMAELRARRALAVHAARPGHRRPGRGAAPACAQEGQAARLERVRRNWRCLLDGLRALGLQTYLRDEVASPVIATFYAPADPNYDAERLFELLWRRALPCSAAGSPPEPTFRIGCMGAIDEAVMREVVRALATSLAAMGVRDCRPAAAPAAAE